MEYNIKAKPTLYKGIEFRSRLEARWAAFFDLLGWKWEYEPCDFDGWYPDFVLFGEKTYKFGEEDVQPFEHDGEKKIGHDGRIFVEVKPVIEFPKEVGLRMVRSLPNKFESELLILGQRPLGVSDEWHEGTRLGWIAEGHIGKPSGLWWQNAIIGCWKDSKYPIGFAPEYGDYCDRISGEHHPSPNGDKNYENAEIDRVWGIAHKIVRFESKKKK